MLTNQEQRNILKKEELEIRRIEAENQRKSNEMQRHLNEMLCKNLLLIFKN